MCAVHHRIQYFTAHTAQLDFGIQLDPAASFGTMPPVSQADALALHNAIHSDAVSVKLKGGGKLPVTVGKNKCRQVTLPDCVAMEQNKAKSSKWATMAKEGRAITWLVGGASPSQWGRIVDGKVESCGSFISKSDDSAKAAAKGKGGASAKIKAKAVAEAKAEAAHPVKSGKAIAKSAMKTGPAKAVKGAAKEKVLANSDHENQDDAAGPPPAKKSKVADPLGLKPLFDGSGYGEQWGALLRPIIEGLDHAAKFIGPTRNKRMVPVRELTFQALKPNPPQGWRVVSLGQSPFPRLESATGIAHFDNTITDWTSKRFGVVLTMKCIIKAAAMYKYGVQKTAGMVEIRNLLKNKSVVKPAEWFQAMLTQGVLFMNAALTLLPAEDTSRFQDADEHTKFWRPVLEAVVDAILTECGKNGRGIVFAWWGTESLKTKAYLSKCFAKHAKVPMEHCVHKNPAAMADAFCDAPNVFEHINKALVKMGLDTIDWLPSEGWEKKAGDGEAEKMGAFIAETQDLHKMYLDRLKDGLDDRKDDLEDIVGIASKPLQTLVRACKELMLDESAKKSVETVAGIGKGKLTVDEAAAIHMYTTNALYQKLNAALRNQDRKSVTVYFPYLRLLLSALRKLEPCAKPLYRGVNLDLASQYPEGSTVTWWAVSSCTTELAVANSFGGGTLFKIKPRTSVPIKMFSAYKNEEELVLAPGIQLKVLKVSKIGKGKTEIHLEELDLPPRVR